MRFEVPQFIEVEDKIVGPFTWRQFVYLAGGVGTLIVLYMFLPFILLVLFGLPIAVLSFTLAFQRVNNRPFSIFLESFINFMRKDRLYLWKKDHEQAIMSYPPKIETVDNSLMKQDERRLAALSDKLEFQALEKR